MEAMMNKTTSSTPTPKATRTICTAVRPSTHRRLRRLCADLGLTNADVIDRSLVLLEQRLVAEVGHGRPR